VHGEYQGKESRAEIIIDDGKIVRINIENVQGRRPLEESELKHFEEFVMKKANEIVQKWIDYFVLHKKINFERITRKIK